MARDDGSGGASAFATRSLTVAALIVAAGFLGSRLLGLLRSVIIAQAFGTQPELDAYWVAFRLPDLVFQLLAGATLASAFIPTFAGVRARFGDDAAWRLASSVLNLVLLATAAFAVVAFLLAPKLVPLMAPGLGDGTGREQELNDLAVNLTRVMLVSPVLFAVSGMFMGILNARRHFLTTALAPMFYNLAIIGAALVSTDVKALAIGVVVGSALHLAVQLPDLRLAGMTYRLVADWRDRAVREVGALMAPRVLGLAATQVNFYFIGIFFASTLSAGAISGSELRLAHRDDAAGPDRHGDIDGGVPDVGGAGGDARHGPGADAARRPAAHRLPQPAGGHRSGAAGEAGGGGAAAAG